MTYAGGVTLRRSALASLLGLLAGAAACTGSDPQHPGTSSSTTSSSSTTQTGTGGTGGMMPDPDDFAGAPKSCVYDCPQAGCAELQGGYACQNLGAWKAIPHADTCEAWDGTFPAATPGKCTATTPTGEALKLAGPDPDDPTVRVLPDGRRLAPAGASWVFPEPDDAANNAVAVPGTSFVLTVDLGYGDHLVRVIDTSKIGAGDPTVAKVSFPAPEALNQGLAFVPPGRVYVSTAQGVAQALTLDTATGALARDDAASITLPPSPGSPHGTFWSSGVAASADGKRLFVSGVKDASFFVADIDPASATYRAVLGSTSLGATESWALHVDPHDPSSRFVYALMRGSHAVVELDVQDPSKPALTRTFQVEKDPEGAAFLDARWMVVANDLGDSLSLVDRVSAAVTTVPVSAATTLKGFEPSSLAWDEARHRLYVTQAGTNALAAYDVDLAKTPPLLTPMGRLPTQWWPTAVVAAPDGSVVVTSLLSTGAGPRLPDLEYELLHGGIQRVAAPSAADLTAGEAKVTKNNEVSKQSGYATVSCPPGASDFPVPETNTKGPSAQIDHVFYVVRENKTFDGLMGDMPGVKGDPTLTLVPKGEMDGIWTNLRALARTFTHGDNFYTSAFISTQGHLWTTHGRTDDYNEREWPVTGYSRGLRGDGDSGGVADLGRPAEGSMFDWLGAHGVPYDVLGEIVGVPTKSPSGHNPFDTRYPGGLIQNIGYPDVEKACYVAGRARVRCDLGNVVYMTLPNDHSQGLSTTRPTPQTMFAVNDEATGMLVDAVSHSPLWKRSLVVVVEDDPSQGGESVDYHRTILLLASPWVKRGYVTHAHVDIASVHKLIAHLFALPYPNVEVAAAPLPLDVFTSTPDYTPYDYKPRTYAAACGLGVTSAEQALTDSWDMDEPDEQPGLDAQVRRWLAGKQLTELPPGLRGEVERRLERRAKKGR